jgi:DNA-binding NarL/FixJ family response regulator
MTIRVLLADDHAVLRDGLTALLGAQEGMAVVAQARDGREAVRKATEIDAFRGIINCVLIVRYGWQR